MFSPAIMLVSGSCKQYSINHSKNNSTKYLSSKRYLSSAPSKKMCQYHFAAVDYGILLITSGTTSGLKRVGEQCQIGEGITSLKFHNNQHIISNIASDGLELETFELRFSEEVCDLTYHNMTECD